MKTHSLGEFEHIVMLALVRLGTQAYGMTIRREIEQRIKRNVSIGAIYTTLERLEKKGLITSRKGEPTSERGGRAKRYFRVNAPGLKALSRARESMQRMWDGLEPVLDT